VGQPNSQPSYRRFSSDSRLIVGRLEAHGPAKYHFRPDQSASYFLKVITSRGTRILWGKDLERAIAQSRTQPKIGSHIGVRRTGYETFAIPEGAGACIVKRNLWMIESAQFFAERAQLARRVRDAHADARTTTKSHPELVSTFLSLRGAQAIAERRIADPKDRERFLALVREAMAKSIKAGKPLPDIRLRDRIRLLDKKAPPVRAIKREDPAR
jgi:hypothetical protein